MARLPILERPTPRISANDLALFMVSSDTARIGIIRRAKSPQIPPIIRYRDARGPICAYLSDPVRSLRPLTAANEMFQQRAEDAAESTLRRDDARQSIEVLRAIQGMANRLGTYDFQAAPAQQDRLTLSEVEVSVRADLIVHGEQRGQGQIGYAVLRMTQSDAETDAALARRREMGLYVATMARRLLDQNNQSNRTPANRLCLSIDVQHGEAFAAPTAANE